MPKTTNCDHDVRVKGEVKVCATCKAALGQVYSLTKLMEDIRWLLSNVIAEYTSSKAQFQEQFEENPANAIRWSAYGVLTLHHRAEQARDLLNAMEGAKSVYLKREFLRDEKSRLTAILTRPSAIEWDNSTSAFANQNEKALHAAEAKTIETISYVESRIDHLEEEQNLPRVKA